MEIYIGLLSLYIYITLVFEKLLKIQIVHNVMSASTK